MINYLSYEKENRKVKRESLKTLKQAKEVDSLKKKMSYKWMVDAIGKTKIYVNPSNIKLRLKEGFRMVNC